MTDIAPKTDMGESTGDFRPQLYMRKRPKGRDLQKPCSIFIGPPGPILIGTADGFK